ncbi:VCBS domain-containing protein, partial [Craterilacuibacter sp. RT1T]|uniref:VCBS domain-containing protein n=1 Tax=Craterilacuibacter sp. RT1T TaxID=2942211 RepID=UPI0020BDBF0A
DDGAVITPSVPGADQGLVVEDTTLSTGGTLLVTDKDAGQSGFKAQADVKVTYGSFSFNEKTGEWTFKLDNAKAQELTANDTLKESFTVEALDGTKHTVEVTIKGTDDGAVITPRG